MVIHLMIAAKTPIMQLFRLTPFLLPFNIWVPLVRQFPRLCQAVTSTSSLLCVRLRQIVSGSGSRRLSRWERAVRLFWYELLLPLGGRLGVRSSNGEQEEQIQYFHRRTLLLNALDASIIQGLLSVSI